MYVMCSSVHFQYDCKQWYTTLHQLQCIAVQCDNMYKVLKNNYMKTGIMCLMDSATYAGATLSSVYPSGSLCPPLAIFP